MLEQIGAGFGMLMGLVLWFGMPTFSRLFTKDSMVLEIVASLTPVSVVSSDVLVSRARCYWSPICFANVALPYCEVQYFLLIILMEPRPKPYEIDVQSYTQCPEGHK
jgi:hypothetical protein